MPTSSRKMSREPAPLGFDYLYGAEVPPSWERSLLVALRRYKAGRDRWKAGRPAGDEEEFVGHPALALHEQIGEAGVRVVNGMIERSEVAFDDVIATAALADADGILPDQWLIVKLLELLANPGSNPVTDPPTAAA